MEAAESILRAGYRLDRYELLCPIASGGMATVWLARLRGKRGFEKLYAIKTIRTELLDDARFQEMLLDEARIASGIQHPNVAQILDLGEQEGVLFIVMEWVDGDSLAKVRRLVSKRGHRLPLGVVLRILADASAGLHAAHELRDAEGHALEIVHRDVSPQNILLSGSGAVKIIDFGIAKAHGRSQGETRTGVVKGKIQYMAPEQVKKDRSVDRRTDVWALGACLYELASGKLPYDGDDDVEVIRKLMNDEAPRIEEGLPEAIVRVLERSIALDADARFPTAAGMHRALESAMKEIGEAATSDDVGAFLRSELPELAQKRKDIVARAVDDARDRGTPSGRHEAERDVAFAPTIMSQSPPTVPGPKVGRAGDLESGPLPRGKGAGRPMPAPTGVSVALDLEPIEIPKKSKAWLWVTLLVLVVAGGAAYAWPAQARSVLAALGIGTGPGDATLRAIPVPMEDPSASTSAAHLAPSASAARSATPLGSAAAGASAPIAPRLVEPMTPHLAPSAAHHTWPLGSSVVAPGSPSVPRSEPTASAAPPTATATSTWSPYKPVPTASENPYESGPVP